MPEIDEAAGGAAAAPQDAVPGLVVHEAVPALDDAARIAGMAMAAELQMALGNGPRAVDVVAEVVGQDGPATGDEAPAPAGPRDDLLPAPETLAAIVSAGLTGRYGYDKVTTLHVPAWRAAGDLAAEEAIFFQAIARDVMEPVRAAFGETAEAHDVRIVTAYSDSRGRGRTQVFAVQGLLSWLHRNGRKEDSLALDLTTAGLSGAKPSTQVWRVPGFTFVVTEDRFSRWSPTARKGSTDPVTIWNIYGWPGGLPFDPSTLHRQIPAEPPQVAVDAAQPEAAPAEAAAPAAHAPAAPVPAAPAPAARVDALHRVQQIGRGAVTVRREIRPIGTNAGASLVGLGMKMIEHRGYPTYVGHPTAGLEITVFGQYRRPFNLSEEYLVRIEGKAPGQPNGEQRHPSIESMVDAVSRLFDEHGIKPEDPAAPAPEQAVETSPLAGPAAMQAA